MEHFYGHMTITGPVQSSKSEKVKFVDDGTVAESINLKGCLVPDPEDRQRPLNYNERTCQILPAQNNLLQFYLDDAEKFTMENKMKINPRKTKVLSFNKSRQYDFPPELHFSDLLNLTDVSELKLVGVVLTNNLKWQMNTSVRKLPKNCRP